MFFRRKRSGRTENLQIVKNERVDGKPRQSVVVTLGRVDELAQDGTLDRLLRSGAHFAHNAVVLTAYEHGKHYILRNTAPSCAGTVLRILGVAAPSRHRPRLPRQKLRGRPCRRSANARTLSSNALI
jgi:hypothetical protein